MKIDLSFSAINKLAIPALIAGIAEPIISATDLAIIGNLPEHSVEAASAVGIVVFLSLLSLASMAHEFDISHISAEFGKEAGGGVVWVGGRTP